MQIRPGGVGAVHVQVLFKGLVDPFGLSILFWVVTQSEVKVHVQGLSQRSWEPGDKSGASVWYNMGGYAVLCEYMGDEQRSESRRVKHPQGGNEHGLFG